jgi:DNA-binding response OmpR family regulator
MEGAHAELISGIRRPPAIDLPRVLVAAATTAASSSIAQALRDAGYAASTARAGTDVLRDLRNQNAIELLVLDGSERPRIVGSIIEAVRAINWALPIVLISRPDPELRSEAERLGVEAILESPVAAEEILRAAAKIVPVIPEVELDSAG